MNEAWTYSKSIESSIKDSHAIIILTDWSEFKNLEWDLLFKKMQRPAWIFDTRYIVDAKILQKIGFICIYLHTNSHEVRFLIVRVRHVFRLC